MVFATRSSGRTGSMPWSAGVGHCCACCNLKKAKRPAAHGTCLLLCQTRCKHGHTTPWTQHMLAWGSQSQAKQDYHRAGCGLLVLLLPPHPYALCLHAHSSAACKVAFRRQRRQHRVRKTWEQRIGAHCSTQSLLSCQQWSTSRAAIQVCGDRRTGTGHCKHTLSLTSSGVLSRGGRYPPKPQGPRTLLTAQGKAHGCGPRHCHAAGARATSHDNAAARSCRGLARRDSAALTATTGSLDVAGLYPHPGPGFALERYPRLEGSGAHRCSG